LSDFELALKSS